jgi:UDP-3-O-[3-hydroxymyristoyl] glucosamine N-acyltransferase
LFTVAQIADYLNAKVVGDEKLEITSIAPLNNAETGALSFCAQAKFVKQISLSNASAVLIKEKDLHWVKKTAIVVEDPYLAFAKITQWLDWRAPIISGIAPNAVIATSSYVAKSAQICHGVVIGENCEILANCYIGPNTVIGAGCIIGDNTRLEANTTLYQDVQIGNDCIVHSSAVIGADGFGFAKKSKGWQKIYQLGGVRIGNDVEIGAATTIDRGALENTVIEDGVKLDNQVQIAHNVKLGKFTAIAGCTAIAGSTELGENCTVAGMSGITGHLNIVAGTHVTAMSLVSHSIKEAGVYSAGTGIEKHQSWKKNVVRFRQLDSMARRIKKLESELMILSLKEQQEKI